MHQVDSTEDVDEVDDFLERHGDAIAGALDEEERLSKLSPWVRSMLKVMEPLTTPSPRGHLLFDEIYMEAALNGRNR